MALEQSGYLVTQPFTTFGEMVNLITDTTIPTDTGIDVIVKQDTDSDGTAENEQTVSLSGGAGEENTLTGFESQDGSDLWARIELSTTDTSVTPEVNSVSVEADIGRNTVVRTQIFSAESKRLQPQWRTSIDVQDDWLPAQDRKRVVVDDVGVRSADQVSLGYDPTISPFADNLELYAPLDETSGSVSANYGSGSDGEYGGNPTFGEAGIVGSNSPYFAGNDSQYAAWPTKFGVSGESFTVGLWLKSDGSNVSSSNNFIITNHASNSSYNDGTDNAFFAIGTEGATDGMLYWVRDETKDNNYTSGYFTPAWDGDWHLYILRRDASADEVSFFIDGQEQETTSFPGDVNLANPDSQDGTAIMTHSSRTINGNASDVFGWSEAKSDQFIQDLFDVTSSGYLVSEAKGVSQ